MSTQKNIVTLYTTTVCPFCVMAKRFLTQKNIEHEEIDVSTDFELRDKISKENGGFRTVPMILVGDTFVGGYNEMMELVRTGEFDKLILGE